MLIDPTNLTIWLYGQPTDMRKSFDGLSALVKTKLEESPLSGQLFVFINRRKTQMKILYYANGGYCVWAKRLDQGQFNAAYRAEKQALRWMDLQCLIDGIDLRSVHRYKRFQPTTPLAHRVS